MLDADVCTETHSWVAGDDDGEADDEGEEAAGSGSHWVRVAAGAADAAGAPFTLVTRPQARQLPDMRHAVSGCTRASRIKVGLSPGRSGKSPASGNAYQREQSFFPTFFQATGAAQVRTPRFPEA
jgi:hypothetical protein